MNSELENLLERSRITDCINHLFIGTDNRDWNAVRECFASRVLFDMSSLGAGEPQEMSPDDIIAAWEEGLKPLQAIHHQTGNFLVTVTDKDAEAFCYGTASHYRPNTSGANTRTFVGSYEFALSREKGDWKIRGFKFNLKYIDGNLNLEQTE